MIKNNTRNHLFISYAGEDVDLAEWLTLKLTSEGYLVWCDRFKLLGGESYPKDIDKAIKNSTFRLIALLSKNSLSKPNPMKERTIALNIATERKEDFLIPINVDGLRPSELDWMTSDLTFIPFYKSWATGLNRLIKKLSSINTPKALKNGRKIAAETFLNWGLIGKKRETVYANYLKILKIPNFIKEFNLNAWITKYALLELVNNWAFYSKDHNTFFAFHNPPKEISENYRITYEGKYNWQEADTIDGIYTGNIVSNLLKRSINVELCRKGLATDKNKLYFPFDPLTNNKIHFRSYTGKNTTVKACGKRTWRVKENMPESFFYHLSPSFKIKYDPIEGYLALLTIQLYITDTSGEPLKRKSAFARSRKIRRHWWNHEWFIRYLAVVSFLSDGKDTITIGEDPEEQIVISANFIKGKTPLSIIKKEKSKHLESIDEDNNEQFDDEWEGE